jgi:hypothetical protein
VNSIECRLRTWQPVMRRPWPEHEAALDVYTHLLTQPTIHFLIADDPGAGKTIMGGLTWSRPRERTARRSGTKRSKF